MVVVCWEANLENMCVRQVAVMMRYCSWLAVARPLHNSHKIAHATICATKMSTDDRQLCKYLKRHPCKMHAKDHLSANYR
jgi:hypothetical protein